jgi:uncharacterized membrane protein YtjA (UPF0391 family)
MLTLALICLVIALLAGAFGFTGLSSTALGAAKFLVMLKVICVIFALAFLGFLFARLMHPRHV